MGFNSAFKGLNKQVKRCKIQLIIIVYVLLEPHDDVLCVAFSTYFLITLYFSWMMVDLCAETCRLTT